LRECDGVEVAETTTGFGQDALGERKDPPHMIARRKLGHDAAVGLVHRDLRVQRMREESTLRVVDGEARLVAGSLDAEYFHRWRFRRRWQCAANEATKLKKEKV
jgi:hypothetical protein